MLPVIFTVIFLAETAFSHPFANQYVDNLLGGAFFYEVKALNLDPAPLPDFEVEFEDKVRIIGKVKGEADFFNGNLTGLSLVKRHSECQGLRGLGSESKITNCTIYFEELKILYDGKMKYGKMPKVGIRAKAKFSDTKILMEIVQAHPTSPYIKTFSFVNLGKLKAKFTGLGPLNRFTNALEDGFKGHVQAEIFNTVSQRLHFAFNRAVAQVPLPFF